MAWHWWEGCTYPESVKGTAVTEDPKKSRTEQRMDKLIVRYMKLKPDIALILRNQHAIMLTLSSLLSAVPADPRPHPVLRHQIDQTDESKG